MIITADGKDCNKQVVTGLLVKHLLMIFDLNKEQSVSDTTNYPPCFDNLLTKIPMRVWHTDVTYKLDF